MIRAVYGLMGAGMCLLSASAFANLNLTNYNGFEVRNSGNTWSFSHESPESTKLRGGTVLPNAQVSSSGRALVVSKTLPIGKGLPVFVVAKIPAAKLAGVLVAAGRLGTPIGAALGVVSLVAVLKDLGIEDVRNTVDGLVGGKLADNTGISDGFEYMASPSQIWTSDPTSACMAALPYRASDPGKWSVKEIIYSGSIPISCVMKSTYEPERIPDFPLSRRSSSSCPAGNYVTPNGCTPLKPSTQISEQEILDKITSSDKWDDATMQALRKALELGAPLETDAPTVTGPSSVPGEKTTTSDPVSLIKGTNTPAPSGATDTDPGTKTTTKTKTEKAEYSGSEVKTSTTTNTVTNITNNVTNITTTETSTETKEDDKEQEDSPVDTPLGDIPELYKQKYPDGIAGVLNTKFDELKATPLFRLPSLLMPSLPSSGSCPSWQLDLSLASWADMGTHTVQAPCWVWDFGKVVVIISALLLARRLIFGG